jgi:hypothetical protein
MVDLQYEDDWDLLPIRETKLTLNRAGGLTRLSCFHGECHAISARAAVFALSWSLRPAVSVYRVDPIRDPRWQRLLLHHPDASIFHTPGWLEALRRTYGYQPIAVTTSPPGRELADGLVLCHVKSWVTGRRLVSVPFADHCEPLVDGPDELNHLLSSPIRDVEKQNLKYLEIRPTSARFENQSWFSKSRTFWLHHIDLRPSLDQLFRSFHKTCIQRKVQRACRELVTYEEGGSEKLLRSFYCLVLLTRRRHQLPPQPLNWFRNLLACLGENAKIRMVFDAGHPIAGIMTLQFRNIVVYKYGCSDPAYHRFGGIQFLLWRAIQQAKEDGAREFDLGRSDYDATGLVTFKDRWGSTRSPLVYWRYPARTCGGVRPGWIFQASKRALALLPDRFLAAAGNLVYRHLA